MVQGEDDFNFSEEPEWMETEQEKVAKALPEAPACANVKVYIDGFGAQITVRGIDYKALVNEVEEMVKLAKLKGWQPSWNPETNKAAATATPKAEDSKWCSLHGEPMPKKWSEKKQKNYWAHMVEGKYCFGS